MSNVEYLVPQVRGIYGDTTYSDEAIIKVICSAVNSLGKRLDYKYTAYNPAYVVNSDIPPSGYMYYLFIDGKALVPSGSNGDVIRNPHREFTQEQPPVIDIVDSDLVVYQTVYLLRLSELSSDSRAVQTWRAADVSVTRSTSRNQTLLKLLAEDEDRLKEYNVVNPKIVRIRP